jgi:hypothetical protein
VKAFMPSSFTASSTWVSSALIINMYRMNLSYRVAHPLDERDPPMDTY